MSSNLALLLCIVFICTAFIKDYGRARSFSFALWIPLIWLLICSSRLPSRWMNLSNVQSEIQTASQAYTTGNSFDSAVFGCLIVSGLIVLYIRRVPFGTIFRTNLPIFLFFIFIGLSAFWADYPGATLRKWIKVTGNVVMVLIVLSEINYKEAISLLLRRCTYIVIPLSVVFIKYFREIGVGFGVHSGATYLTGVTLGKNQLARICFICLFYIIWDFLNYKKNSEDRSYRKIDGFIDLSLIVAMLWILLNPQANSATTLISMMIAFIIFFFTGTDYIKDDPRRLDKNLILVLLILGPCFYVFNTLFGTVLQTTGHDDTFFGRVDLWKELLEMVKNPIIGEGYGNFITGDRLAILWENHWWHPNQAHNGYLEIYLDLGIMGLAIFLWMVAYSYVNVRNSILLQGEWGRFRFSMFFSILVYNITEAAFRGINLMFFMFLLVSLEAYFQNDIVEGSQEFSDNSTI